MQGCGLFCGGLIDEDLTVTNFNLRFMCLIIGRPVLYEWNVKLAGSNHQRLTHLFWFFLVSNSQARGAIYFHHP